MSPVKHYKVNDSSAQVGTSTVKHYF